MGDGSRVALNLFDMTSAEQFHALDARTIDLGFVGLRPALSGHDLLSESVAEDTILAALPLGHPLAKKPNVNALGSSPTEITQGIPAYENYGFSAGPERTLPADR